MKQSDLDYYKEYKEGFDNAIYTVGVVDSSLNDVYNQAAGWLESYPWYLANNKDMQGLWECMNELMQIADQGRGLVNTITVELNRLEDEFDRSEAEDAR